MIEYIRITPAVAGLLNTLLYTTLVTSDGINFNSPFMEGTTSYLDTNAPNNMHYLDENILSLSALPLVQSALLTRVSQTQAIQNGWLPPLERPNR